MHEKQFDEVFGHISSFLEDKELQEDEGFKHSIKSSFLSLHASEQADLISELKPKQRAKFLSFVGNDIDADVLAHFERAVLIDFAENVGKETFGTMLSLLNVNIAVDVLEEFSKDFRKEILEFIQYKKRIKIKRLLSYPKDTVGRNMSIDFLSIPQDFTVKDTMEYLHRNVRGVEQDIKNTQIFVKNKEERVIGTVSIFELIKLKHLEPITSCMRPIRHFVNTFDDITEVVESFIEYHLQIIPVIDVNSKLVGVLELENIASIIKEEAEKNILMPAGVFEANKEGVIGNSKARFAWLFVNFLTASTASSVITIFEPLVASFAVLATLTPIVASIGGNTGNQSSAVIIRSLAIRDFESRRVFLEVATAFLNSILFASIAFILSYVLHRNFLLSLSFGLAIFVNINIGGMIGSAVPLIINKLKVDPALCSSIFVTMMTDMIGFFSFLGIAYLLFTSYGI